MNAAQIYSADNKKGGNKCGDEGKQDEIFDLKPKNQSTSKEEEENRFTLVPLTGEKTDEELDELAERMLEALDI